MGLKSDPASGASSGLPTYGVKEFIQVFGVGIAAAIISMWATQKVLSAKMEIFTDRLEAISVERRLEANRNREYFKYTLESYAKRHDEECREMKRRIDLITSGLYSGKLNSLGD